MRLPTPANDYDPKWAGELVLDLELALTNSAGNAARGFSYTNATATRSFDVSTVTLSELADVVATLISDMGATT